MSLALIADGHAHFVGVEGPILGALEALLVVPVPFGASQVSGLGRVERGELADTVDEVITLEAGSAGAGVVVALALILNGNADFVETAGAQSKSLEDEAL